MDSSTSHANPVPQRDNPSAAEYDLRIFLHDINNHLGIVMGNAELLLDVGTNEEKRPRRTQAIHTSASQAAELVAKLQAKLDAP